MWAQVVSASVGLICLVVAGVLHFIVGGGGKGWRKYLPRVEILLVLTGVTGLLSTPLGGFLHRVVGLADSSTGRVTGAITGVVLVGLVGLVAVVVVIVGLSGNKAKAGTLIAAALAPVAVVTIPGPLGDVLTGGTNAVTGMVAWGIGSAFGLGG